MSNMSSNEEVFDPDLYEKLIVWSKYEKKADKAVVKIGQYLKENNYSYQYLVKHKQVILDAIRSCHEDLDVRWKVLNEVMIQNNGKLQTSDQSNERKKIYMKIDYLWRKLLSYACGVKVQKVPIIDVPIAHAEPNDDSIEIVGNNLSSNSVVKRKRKIVIKEPDESFPHKPVKNNKRQHVCTFITQEPKIKRIKSKIQNQIKTIVNLIEEDNSKQTKHKRHSKLHTCTSVIKDGSEYTIYIVKLPVVQKKKSSKKAPLGISDEAEEANAGYCSGDSNPLVEDSSESESDGSEQGNEDEDE